MAELRRKAASAEAKAPEFQLAFNLILSGSGCQQLTVLDRVIRGKIIRTALLLSLGLTVGAAVGWGIWGRDRSSSPGVHTMVQRVDRGSGLAPTSTDLAAFLSLYPGIQAAVIHHARLIASAKPADSVVSADIERWSETLFKIEKLLVAENGVRWRDWLVWTLLLRPVDELFRLRVGETSKRIGPTIIARTVSPILQRLEMRRIEAALELLDVDVNTVTRLELHLATDGLR